MKRILLLLLSFLGIASFQFVEAQYYSLYVGEQLFLETPDPPYDGWIEFANWSRDSHVAFKEDNDWGAIVYPTHYFEGTETVTCTYAYGYYIGNYKRAGYTSKTYYIKCNAIPFSLDVTELELKVGKTHKLTVSYPSSYTKWTLNLKYNWESSNEDVATVSNDGRVSSVKPGNCIITLDPIAGPEVYCKVSVVTDPPKDIKVTPESLSLVEGNTGVFSYELYPKDSYTKVEWSSSSDEVAKVNSRGVVSAISGGEAIITATTENGLKASGRVEVIPLPKQVTLQDIPLLSTGYSMALKPILTPSNAAQVDYSWKSSDETIAIVDQSGRVFGKKKGKATITITTSNKLSASCEVVVGEAKEGLDNRSVMERIKYIRSLKAKTIK
ncbi:MAG: Ig domain-containing protein [Bacteroidaceae bacterium]|nr:Ig domain-containing protein [Bacteroidaceae bacterium]